MAHSFRTTFPTTHGTSVAEFEQKELDLRSFHFFVLRINAPLSKLVRFFHLEPGHHMGKAALALQKHNEHMDGIDMNCGFSPPAR